LKFKLEESELRATKVRETSKELEEDLTMYKNEAME